MSRLALPLFRDYQKNSRVICVVRVRFQKDSTIKLQPGKMESSNEKPVDVQPAVEVKEVLADEFGGQSIEEKPGFDFGFRVPDPARIENILALLNAPGSTSSNRISRGPATMLNVGEGYLHKPKKTGFCDVLQMKPRVFIGSQEVMVNGRLGCLLGTYNQHQLTNSATYGVVAFSRDDVASFLVKSSGGEVQPTDPVRLASDDVWKELLSIDVSKIILDKHLDKVEGDIKTVVADHQPKGKRTRKQTNFFKSVFPPRPEKKIRGRDDDSEATEDEEQETSGRKSKKKVYHIIFPQCCLACRKMSYSFYFIF